jgi:predicted negative regulator of RcsB-dependent stress response
MAQFHIVKGDAYLMSGNIENASEMYCKNIDAVDEDEEGEIVDLATISKLRLSNCKMAQSDLKRAQ